MYYVFMENQVRVTREIRWKKVWPNNTSIQKLYSHVETVALLKAIRDRLHSGFHKPMVVAEICNTFPGERGFISEEDPPGKVEFINTTVQEPSAEADSWHKILWTHCLYSLGVVRV